MNIRKTHNNTKVNNKKKILQNNEVETNYIHLKEKKHKLNV